MEEIDWSIHDLLREMGLNRTYTGYQYLAYIVKLIRREPGRLEQVTKWVYPEVCREFRVEPSWVDSALRTAARACWQFSRSRAFANPERESCPPTVSQFLYQLAQEDRRRRDEKN